MTTPPGGPFTPQQELALLGRALVLEGYDDHHLGHISYRQPDGTILVNPWGPGWEELRARDVVRIDIDGRILDGGGFVGDGQWTVSPALELHLALHRARDDIIVGLHNHARWGTVWSALGRVPPAYDQQASLLREERIGFFEDYVGAVSDPEAARRNIEGLAANDVSFLANHGVMVLGATIQEALHRATALEHRCRQAWRVEAVGGGRPMPPEEAHRLGQRSYQRGGTRDLFVYMARKVIGLDPRVLE